MSRQAFLGFLMSIKHSTPEELNKLTTEELGKLYSYKIVKELTSKEFDNRMDMFIHMKELTS